MTQLTACQ